MTEKPIEYYQERGHYNPIEAERLGVPLRVSKSSFMGYLWCPRQWWWNNIELADIRTPPTDAMLRGTDVHDALDSMYDKWDGDVELRPLFPSSTAETAYDVMVELENQRMDSWGVDSFAPVEHEVLHQVYYEPLNIMMVGKFDGVLRHPEGGLCLLELKTGGLASRKLSKTRQELCFYELMCRLMDWEPVTHFAFMAPDCDNADLVQGLMGQKRNKKELFLGDERGISIIEKVAGRSLKAFEKSLTKVIDGIRSHDWSMSWNDYTCPQYCEFHMACEQELGGLMTWD